MTDARKVYSSTDAQPIVLFAKTDVDSQQAYPVTAAMFNPGLSLPPFDSFVLGYTSTNLTSVTYTSSGSTVAIIVLNYSGTTLTGITRTV